jgi:hypothetical protein
MDRRPLAVALVLLAAGPVWALDHPVDAVKLVLRRTKSHERLDFVTRDPSFLFPAVGSADDPVTGTPGGAVVELFSLAEGSAATDVPAVGWSLRTKGLPRYRFRNPDAPGGGSAIRRMEVRQGKTIRIQGRATLLPLAGPQGALAIRITTGSLRTCARFEGDAIKRDDADRFIGRGALAAVLADCDDLTLRPPVCGDGVAEGGEACDGADDGACPGLCQADCSCPSPVCGDGVVNQPTERCDGSLGSCIVDVGQGFDPVGCSADCQCCSGSSLCYLTIPSVLYCCDPDKYCRYTGPGAFGECVSLLCNTTADCLGAETCVDGRCCVPHGAFCIFGGFSPPCCVATDICAGQVPASKCCAPAGQACTVAADCCSGACSAGTCDP